MRDRPYIVAGVALFVAFVTLPIWHGVAARKTALTRPEIRLPSQARECVAPVSYMRTSHMQLLQQWQRDVVRGQRRQYVAYNGKTYDKSLTGTCLTQCHGSREEFCVRCHNYSGVPALDCWQCHSDATPAARKMP